MKPLLFISLITQLQLVCFLLGFNICITNRSYLIKSFAHSVDSSAAHGSDCSYFFIAYSASKIFGMSHDIAAPAGMIGASNFFELAVAVAIALFGTTSPAALATTVGVLTEVPVMLALVKVANSTRGWFKK